jgi:hypothetical protein
MKRIILLLICLCMFCVVMSGCDFKNAAAALKKTMETISDEKETTAPPTEVVDISVVKLTETIRIDNKTNTGNKTQWIEMYKEKLYPNSYKQIIEITSAPIAEFDYMSDESKVEVTEFYVTFPNEVVDTLIAIDFDSAYLIDIINKKSMPEVYDNYYIFDIVKADPRFQDKLVSDIMNKVPEGTAEFDLTALTQLNNNYYLSDVKPTVNKSLEITYVDTEGANPTAFELDYRSSVLKPIESSVPENTDSDITSLNSPDNKHTAYIDDETGNLYVRDIDTGDVWLIYEYVISPKENPIINYVYKDKLIYSIASIDSFKGFGIYDFKSNSNTIYLDDVDIHGIQNGILFLNGSGRTPANPSFTVNLNSDEYKITDISSIFTHNVYLSENGTFYAAVNSYTGETRVTIYNTSDNKVRGEYVFDLVSAHIFNVMFNDNDLILICSKNALGHDYLYSIKLS